MQVYFLVLKSPKVKAPKIYLRDSGLLHALLGISDWETLLSHPRVGAAWEGFVIEQFLLIVRPAEAYFWATHSSAEVDLFFLHQGRRYGIEVKFSEAPEVTRSMHVALQDFQLEHLWVVHPGPHTYPVHEKITVCSIHELANLRSHFQ